MFNDSFDSGKANIDNQADDSWGEPIDFTIEEILDMPVMGEVQTEPTLTNTDCNEESHDNSNHGIFCVTGNDLDYIDIDDLY